MSGQIKSITDFGIFIGLAGNIDGLVHLSDISWDVPGEEAVRNYQKGQQLEAMVLSIDPERERISLGIKQLAQGSVLRLDRREPEGHHRAAARSRKWTRAARSSTSATASKASCAPRDLARDRVEDARTVLKEGEEIEAKFTGVDRKTRTISLSIKAKEMHEEAGGGVELPLRAGSSVGHEPRRPAQGTDRRSLIVVRVSAIDQGSGP